MIWRYHTPERDGHAPDDVGYWCDVEIFNDGKWRAVAWEPCWKANGCYRYRPLQDATVEPSFDTLKDQCLALPQDQREAIIEAMQKPQPPKRDWADDVLLRIAIAWDTKASLRLEAGDYTIADKHCLDVIRFMCRPKEECNYASKDWRAS